MTHWTPSHNPGQVEQAGMDRAVRPMDLAQLQEGPKQIHQPTAYCLEPGLSSGSPMVTVSEIMGWEARYNVPERTEMSWALQMEQVHPRQAEMSQEDLENVYREMDEDDALRLRQSLKGGCIWDDSATRCQWTQENPGTLGAWQWMEHPNPVPTQIWHQVTDCAYVSWDQPLHRRNLGMRQKRSGQQSKNNHSQGHHKRSGQTDHRPGPPVGKQEQTRRIKRGRQGCIGRNGNVGISYVRRL